MATEEKAQELIKGIYDAVIRMDEATVSELSRAVVDEGIDAYYAVTEGLAKAMTRVGELYESGEYFVPELLLCSDALYAGVNILRPHIVLRKDENERQLIIGTVEGDIHEIGKNLVTIMFEAAGWVVHDIGVDVKMQRFIDEQARTGADVIALSAIMTTSMTAMPKTIARIKGEFPGVSVMVGGAPLSNEIATSYGADGYASNAVEAVRKANEMLMRIKK